MCPGWDHMAQKPRLPVPARPEAVTRRWPTSDHTPCAPSQADAAGRALAVGTLAYPCVRPAGG